MACDIAVPHWVTVKAWFVVDSLLTGLIVELLKSWTGATIEGSVGSLAYFEACDLAAAVSKPRELSGYDAESTINLPGEMTVYDPSWHRGTSVPLPWCPGG